MSNFTDLQDSFYSHLSSSISGRNDEENRIINDICKEIDLEHELLNDRAKSDSDPGEWLEREIEVTTRELFPDATSKDIETVKEAIEKGIVEDIESEINNLKNEMSDTKKGESDEDKLISLEGSYE